MNDGSAGIGHASKTKIKGSIGLNSLFFQSFKNFLSCFSVQYLKSFFSGVKQI
jgi:hypothetical protein